MALRRCCHLCAGVVRALHEYYQTQDAHGVHVWLSADTDHFCASAGDRGWGCGYRNFQMLLSALLRLETYAGVLQGSCCSHLLTLDLVLSGRRWSLFQRRVRLLLM